MGGGEEYHGQVQIWGVPQPGLTGGYPTLGTAPILDLAGGTPARGYPTWVTPPPPQSDMAGEGVPHLT